MSKKNVLQIGDMTITPEARSRYLTIEIGGKSTRIHYKELWGAMFVLGDGAYREAMIPAKAEERMLFSRQLRVRASKDIKAGEEIVVWTEIDVSKVVVSAIAERNGAKVIEPSAALSTAAADPKKEAGV